MSAASQRVFLSLAIHNHQPVGNFPHVFETAYRQSYLPMLAALEQHPAIPIALHYSGPLLDWLEGAHPEFFPQLGALVDRGQVELMTGGYYEPILAIIPDRDKHGQIRKMTDYLHRRLDAHADGLWLAERVWEPHLAKPLAEAGVMYTIVDDAHFLAAGMGESELTGYFVTEEEGRLLKVLPSLRALRYLIPWKPVTDVMAHLRTFAGGPAAAVLTMGDDGEKFGLWPGTYAHCWEQGWVETFFAALETEQEWLTVLPPGQATGRAPSGRVYLPAASYDEMTEWALPADRSAELAQIRHRLEAGADPAAAFLRGGYWRQFLVKYPEINTMHKKMLRISEKAWRLPAGPQQRQALDELWQGQGNCPYWHGVFGGLYLPHIRHATFAHLIAAEALADPVDGVRVRAADLDADGQEELEVASAAMVLTVDPAEGGSVVEWDWRDRRINFTNVLTRRPEAYHRQLTEPASAPAQAPSGVETIHAPRVRIKDPDLARSLVYDPYRRASFIDHVLDPAATIEAFSRATHPRAGEFVHRAYEARWDGDRPERGVTFAAEGPVRAGGTQQPLRIVKRLRPTPRGLTVEYQLFNLGPAGLDVLFGVETNWAITDPQAPLRLDADEDQARQMREASGVRRIVLTDAGWNSVVIVTVSSARVWVFPLLTISNSEAGVERIFQGACCLCSWPVKLDPQASWEASLRIDLPA